MSLEGFSKLINDHLDTTFNVEFWN